MNRSPKSLLPVVVIVAGVLVLMGVGLWALNPFKSLSAATPAPTTNPADIPYPEIPRVHLPDAKAAFDLKNAVFVDVRGEPFYSQGHIPGALSIPLADISSRLGELKQADWIIPYCT